MNRLLTLERIQDEVHAGYRLTQLLSKFLTVAPDAITPSMMENMKECGLPDGEAYAYLLTALFQMDMNDKSERSFFRNYLQPSIHCLQAERYQNDPYFASVLFPSTRIGNWELAQITYPAYRAFVCGDPIRDGVREYQQIGFFASDYSFPAVMEDGNEWMTLTPVDMDTVRGSVQRARGKCATFGLGLGYYAFCVSQKKEVDSLTIIEHSPDAIKLFSEILLPQFPNKDKIRIICADAFSYAEHELPKEGFDHVFADTWRDAGDGLVHYLRLKPVERLAKDTRFEYWIEETILSRLRSLFFDRLYPLAREGKGDPDRLVRMMESDALRRMAENSSGTQEGFLQNAADEFVFS